MQFETVIGLEVHVQLNTESKLFCGCSTQFGALPNTQVCPVCLGFPGVLPVLNEKAMTYAVMTGLAVGSEISLFSKFDRKNYFYPDLPKAYQVSQYDKPICKGGKISINIDGVKKDIHLTRIHLEEDAGKLTHFDKFSGVDYNRTGIPLIEIVSEPDIRSPQEAHEYLRSLKMILEYLKVSDCNMEEGSLRCDANISLRPVGEKKFGTKAEIKNLNSFRNVEKALEYEIERQTQILNEGGRVVQETRLWSVEEGLTRSMRSKEEAHDYRYFPEPDLLPMQLTKEDIEKIHRDLPELPVARKARFMNEYGLPDYDAGVLTADRNLADFYETAARKAKNSKAAGNWIMGDLLRELNAQNIPIQKSPVSPEHIAELVDLIEAGTVSGKMGKDIFVDMFKTGNSPQEIVKAKGLVQLTDETQIMDAVQKAIQENTKSVQDYLSGKKTAVTYLVGQVMKVTKGRASPKMVNELLAKELDRLSASQGKV